MGLPHEAAQEFLDSGVHRRASMWRYSIYGGALITSYKMIRSLFPKIEREDPDRALSYDEAPGLWELTRRVAETVRTRAVDEIRVTRALTWRFTSAAVGERNQATRPTEYCYSEFEY